MAAQISSIDRPQAVISPSMPGAMRGILFLLFFLSGFASLVDQVVWTRQAFAAFGVIAPVLSVVLSVFMLGLAVGSWAAGRLAGPVVRKTGLSAAYFYGGVELIIGVGALVVPRLFSLCQHVLLPAGQMDSLRYFALSALGLGICIFPWCLCMGATFPFMMAYVKERDPRQQSSFSYLYLANVLGAMAGTSLTAIVLVELFGFGHTLWIAAAANGVIALISLGLGLKQPRRPRAPLSEMPPRPKSPTGEAVSPAFYLAVLFSTGFLSMAMEVVWYRTFAIVLKTQVYSFAMIVFTYLGATFVGSALYRLNLQRRKVSSVQSLLGALAIVSFLPVVMNQPWRLSHSFVSAVIDVPSALVVLGSICPLCAVLGYLTPKLIDEYAAGHPRQAGSAYAINVVGCILGPLLASYVLLPHVSDRIALICLALPLVALWLFRPKQRLDLQWAAVGLGIVVMVIWSVQFSRDFEEVILATQPGSEVRRDYMASVVSLGQTRPEKHLLVNSYGMTVMSPVTKFMAHLPLALHTGRPRSVLVICFGMGTSFRSALSWGVDTTAVELVPSVPKAFGYYYADADKCLANPSAHIVIDDGRRYLRRCARKFDVIIVDPPPPVESAGSSLLFSNEFYALARHHLNPNGILQMWYPGTSSPTGQAVARSVWQSFLHVRAFPSVEGWGFHFLGSMQPIQMRSADVLAAAMPPAAQADLTEWNVSKDAAKYLAQVVNRQYLVRSILNPDPSVRITDDRPFNEYYLLREWRGEESVLER